LHLRVSPPAEKALRGGHPWLFADRILEQNRPGKSGELAVIYDRKDRFLAIGFYDPESALRVRVLHAGQPVTLDEAWWRRRLEAPLERRRGLFDSQTTGYRWINGESDGWPGLVLDRYGDALVVKIYTAAWLSRMKEVAALIREALAPGHLVLRLSRNLKQTAMENYGLEDGRLLFGSTTVAEFVETGLKFEADLARGQKTGFFLDQRENRRLVETRAAGRDVLNAFSFSGGFSLYAARGGAKSVVEIEMSARSLEEAHRNRARNPVQAADCRFESVQADAFEWLGANTARRFDLVILDPPSLAKREEEHDAAVRAYGRLATLALATLRRGGVLVASSCSAHVSEQDFYGIVIEAARKSGRTFRQRAITGHPPDHPATFREARYLKCIYLEETGS
jgi:23S rRNA (cytosine1962-C5)-methyltransferase